MVWLACPGVGVREKPGDRLDGHHGAGSARSLGALLSCYGVGSVLGSLLVAPLSARIDRDRLMGLGTAFCGGCMLLLMVGQHPAVLALAMLGAGCSWSLALTCMNISAQLLLPRELLARGLALSMMALMVSMACGSAVWGAVATVSGVDLAFGAAGAAAIAWPVLQAVVAAIRSRA